MNDKTHTLNELIEITRDGERFYCRALSEVKSPELRQVFEEMAQVKNAVIQALAVKVSANEEHPAQGGTLFGRFREAYADARAGMASDKDATYVGQLEATEDRILAAYEDALKDADVDVQALLGLELPKIRACHARMSALKKSLA
ncbi:MULTISPECIES: ferritin-like domain-containing protein [Pseudomonas]|uniref:ferritin-like domain-containing protein n=1 Tax=Pseudomonas TaxID=286 RepID=UPI00257B069D|nr:MULTISPECIES: PA2169 family four-helix-bundle protein [Pseudomonas]